MPPSRTGLRNLNMLFFGHHGRSLSLNFYVALSSLPCHLYSRRLLQLLLLLLRSSICPVKAACRAVEEGQKTTLTCSLGKKTCSTNKLLDWILASFKTKVIACTTNECVIFHLVYGIYTIINNNGSTLTIPRVTRTGPLNMETRWTCRPCTDSRREVTACDKLVVHAKPENPTCAARENMDQAGHFESFTVSCSTTKVYPKAECNFKRRTKGISDRLSFYLNLAGTEVILTCPTRIEFSYTAKST
ncbi:hypothetical protein PoB_007231900 [Plakobranchus ocellatus]|uniref:Uncharacterized protein n=1 Tax=Plakobranchus ocellatus TaxID=259542 RepID=A0AAV4DNT1_9GAST|nr:hypothetical protein PoB_007231900 [Plakobranchus ocellatus]